MRTIVALALAAGMTGCLSHPALVVEMNGRRIDFETFREGKIPRGLEVSHFDATTVCVNGEIPIHVNGIPILADGDEFTVGDRKLLVDKDAAVLIHEDGQIEVRLAGKITSLPEEEQPKE